EDGIRDYKVTGVQTCALPILTPCIITGKGPPNGQSWSGEVRLGGSAKALAVGQNQDGHLELFYVGTNDAIYHNWQTVNWHGEARSEERRVGKECGCRVWGE